MEFLRKLKLKRYLLAFTLKSMPIVYILVFGIVGILFMPISFSENSTAWIGGYILAPILCAFVLKSILKDVAIVNRQWKELQQQGKLEEMLSDYGRSEKGFGGDLMIGQKYLFGKGSMHLAAFSDICRIFMVNAERKGKFARDLYYEDRDGQQHFICRLDSMGKSHTELDRLYRLVEKKNPMAETGL